MCIFFLSKLQLAEELSVKKVIACFLLDVSVILKGHQLAALYVHLLLGPKGTSFYKDLALQPAGQWLFVDLVKLLCDI